MSLDVKGVAVTFLTAALKALGQAPATPALSAAAPQLGPLATLLGLLPIADLVALIEGRATLDTTLDLAERAAEIVRRTFPPAAMTAAEIEFALKALQFVLDAAGVGGTPIHIEPGYNPIRGGWSGARGHI